MFSHRFNGWGYATAFLLLSSITAVDGNPSGGTIAGGSATISGTGTSSVTITQASNTAVINWNTFSINNGELTTFLQPSSSSAVLNRVTGGSISNIDGTLNANGQVFLINGNGVLVGSTGVINTAGFVGSTLDITDKNFTAGKYKFSGSSANGVSNLGTINALGGNIYLIGHTVNNEGALNAASGTVGLGAGNNVLITQSGSEHLFVNPVKSPISSTGVDAVNNSGSIAATSAELKAANGNMYALAINNGGTIRATTVSNQGGHIWLTSDKGTIVNSGTIDASATAASGTGGQITLKTADAVVQHGKVISHGGQGGTGGTVDLSGGFLDFTGGVDLTSVGGTTGNLLLDPVSIEVVNDPTANGTISQNGSTTTYTPAPGYVPSPGSGYVGSTLYTQVLDAQLDIANVIVNGVNNVTIHDSVDWFAPTSLTLQTTASKGTIVINAPITGIYDEAAYNTYVAANMLTALTGTHAGLIIDAAKNGFVTTGDEGAINVDNFTLKNGIWQQIVSLTPPTVKAPGLMLGPLPDFNVLNDFRLLNTSTFERFAGGDGKNTTASHPTDSPYEIVDLYGLQGIGSPSNTLLSMSFIQDNNIGNSTTNTTVFWNSDTSSTTTPVNGAGWVPIGENGATIKPFKGTFDGNGYVIDGIAFYRPDANMTGLFGMVSGTVENVTLDSIMGQGIGVGGALAGRVLSRGLVDNSATFYSAGALAFPTDPVDGLTDNQSNYIGRLGVSNAAGGFVGEVMSGGKVTNSFSDIGVQIFSLNGSGVGVSGLTGIAGLVGVNYGTITNSGSARGGATNIDVADPGTGANTRNSSISVGGLVGANFGTINGGYSEGLVTGQGSLQGATPPSILSGVGNYYLGGFVGSNYGKINGTVTIKVDGHNVKEQYQSFTTASVNGPADGDVKGGTGSFYLGGFVGANYGTISDAYSAPTIEGATDFFGDPLTPGGIVTGGGSVTNQARGSYIVGGFAGGNFGKIIHSGTEDSVVATGDITGIGNVTKKVNGIDTTVPATVVITQPLLLDSIIVGGFVGLNGSGGSVTGSFSDPAQQEIAFNLDPNEQVPTPADGQTFILNSDPTVPPPTPPIVQPGINPNPNNDPLVYTSGNISGGAGYYLIGGFAGGNYGTLSTSYSAGNVLATGTTTQSNSFYVGGFSGINLRTISNDYETGNAISMATISSNQSGVVGGLVAQQFGGSIKNTYSLGMVTGGLTRGGLIGVLTGGTASGSFWDIDVNPDLFGYSAGGSKVMGEHEEDMMTDTFNEPNSIYAAAHWDFKKTWTVGEEPGFPTLQNVP